MPFIQLIHPGWRKRVLVLIGLSSSFVWLAAANADDGGDAVLREYHSANGLLNRGMHEMAAAEYRPFLAANGVHENSTRLFAGAAGGRPGAGRRCTTTSGCCGCPGACGN